MLQRFILACGLAVGAAHGQGWYVGVVGGYGFARDVTVSSPAGSAKTGFDHGFAVGAFGGNDTYNHWSGEMRYLYRSSGLRLTSGGTAVHFGGRTHIINPEFLAHLRPRESRIRPFLAFGFGLKVVQGTGAESAGQPLGRFAALTATRETLPVGDVGVGVTAKINKSLKFRVEMRDYMGPAPNKVIAPVPGATISGWVHDILGLAGLSYTW